MEAKRMRTRAAVTVFVFLLSSCNGTDGAEDVDVEEEILLSDVDAADVEDTDDPGEEEPECLNDLYCDDHDFCTVDTACNDSGGCIGTSMDLLFDVADIAAGRNHTCALLDMGGVKCWGGNEDGQLGDDTRNDALTPVDVSGLASGVAAIAAGASHTCAILTAGGAKCWGNGDDGQTGNGAPFDRLSPVDVVGLSSGLTAIAGGGKHTCGLLDTGTIQCWGDNFFGQLGDGTTGDRLSPAGVLCN